MALDCPDPRRVAQFYSELTGMPVTYDCDDWVLLARHDQTYGVAFQQAPDHRLPR